VDGVLELDRQLTLWINQHHNPVLDVLVGTVSRLGDAGVAWLMVIGVLLMFGTRRDRIIAVVFLAGLLITEYLAMPALRVLWYRPRPFVYMESIRTIGPEWQRPAFPSSHAHLWGQAALLFAVAYPRLKWPLLVLLVLSLYSRPYVGNHHVLDVLAGVTLGLSIGALDIVAVKKLGVFERETEDEEPGQEPELVTGGEA
jgi:membrane-associated phospholipid phosphatase